MSGAAHFRTKDESSIVSATGKVRATGTMAAMNPTLFNTGTIQSTPIQLFLTQLNGQRGCLRSDKQLKQVVTKPIATERGY